MCSDGRLKAKQIRDFFFYYYYYLRTISFKILPIILQLFFKKNVNHLFMSTNNVFCVTDPFPTTLNIILYAFFFFFGKLGEILSEMRKEKCTTNPYMGLG